MKILYIANIRIPTEKAHGIQIMKMCEAFSGQGHNVTLIVPRRFNHIKDNSFTYYGVKENFKIKKLPTLDLVNFGRIGFWVQSFSFAVFAFIYSIFKKVDVIYSRDELPLFFLSFVNKNLFWEVHTNRHNWLIQRVLIETNGVVAITQSLKKFFEEKKISGQKIMVAHDAVDLNMFSVNKSKEELRNKYKISQDKKVVGYIGKVTSMGRKKGVEDLISAFSEVIKEKPESFLLIVGANKEEIPIVEKMLLGKGVKMDSFMVVGHVKQKEVPNYLKVSDILIMNYPATDHYKYYMSPLKLFEYMASGTPILTTDLPSIREVLSDKDAIFVQPGNTQELVDGIVKVFQDDILANGMLMCAHAHVQKYTWSKRAQNIVNFINDAMRLPK